MQDEVNQEESEQDEGVNTLSSRNWVHISYIYIAF